MHDINIIVSFIVHYICSVTAATAAMKMYTVYYTISFNGRELSRRWLQMKDIGFMSAIFK